jgi:hypothetical protein
MHIIILNNGFYFAGKVRELRSILADMAVDRQLFANFLQRNLNKNAG